MADIDVGQLSEEINDKMDRDMGNQNTGIHHIIETYIDGTSGYRIWDDGFCEQWGSITANNTATSVSFLKTFGSTNYNATVTEYGNTCSGSGNSNPRFYCTSGSSMTVMSGITSGVLVYWKASGYLAEGEY